MPAWAPSGGGGGFFGAIAGFLRSTWGKLAVTAGLDVASALMGGGSNSSSQGRLADRNVTSQNYGSVWPRCRGTVRLPGKVIQSTQKMEVLHKRSFGGFLGIGQQSDYFYTYSVNCAVAFGKKLGGGPASKLLKLWGNGKLIYGAEVTDASLTGSVIVQAGTPAGAIGATTVTIATGNDGAVNMPSGTDFSFAAQLLVTYEATVSLVMGPNETRTLSFWPPLQIELSGGGSLSIPGLNAPFFNQEAFWPQADTERFQNVPPSHVDSDPEPDRAGGIHIYLGTADQVPDQFTIRQFGPKSPGYRGMPYVMLYRLKLSAAFNGEIPSFSAKWAFDDASANNQFVGPVSGVTGVASHNRNSILLPSEWTELGSGQNIPYAVVTAWPGTLGSGAIGTAFLINSNTNALVNSFPIDMTSAGPGEMFFDNDGFIYTQEEVTSPRNLEKYDAFTGRLVGLLGTLGAPATLSADGGMAYDSPQALDPYTNFLKPMRMLLLFAKDSGSVQLIDRGNMIGGGDVGAATMLTNLGGVGAAHIHGTVDRNGDIWIAQSTKLFQCDGKFGTPLPNPLGGVLGGGTIGGIIGLLTGQWIIVYPTMEIKATVDLPETADNIFYDPSDDTIAVLMANDKAVKVDISTKAFTGIGVSDINYPSGTTTDSIGAGTDILGSVTIGAGGSAFVKLPLDQIGIAATITPTAYHVDDFITSSTGVSKTYDPLTNSVWLINANTDQLLYRIYLDRGAGSGMGLDVLAGALFDESGYDAAEYDVTQLSAITVGGWELGEESYQQSLQKLAQLYKFDIRERDGKEEAVLRGQNPVDLIPEDDLGALSDPSSYEPRLLETVTDEKDLPREVHVTYFDHGKNDQQAAQYSSRTTRPFAASLSGAQNVMNSQEVMNLDFPLFDDATQVKKLADVILDDLWASRRKQDFKTSYKYLLLDPADVVNIAYKGILIPSRIMEMDTGAGLALQIKGEFNQSDAYAAGDVVSSPGTGSGGEPTPVPPNLNNYTIDPANPLSNPNAAEIDMSDVTAIFSSGLRTFYNARTFIITDPGAGNSQIYYVSISDPNLTGEAVGTASLTANIGTTAASVHQGELGYIFMGSINAIGATGGGTQTGGGGTGGTGGGTGGTPTTAPTSVLVITAPNAGNFSFAHNLGRVPSWAEIEMVVSESGVRGAIQWASASLRYDATNLYLDASDTGVECVIALW